MRTVKLSGKEYAIYGSGDTAFVCENELHEDMFELMDQCVAIVSGGKPKITPTSKMMYAFIKTANPDAVGSYRTFLQSVRKVSDFISAENFAALIEEITDTMATSNSDDGKKKKETMTKEE